MDHFLFHIAGVAPRGVASTINKDNDNWQGVTHEPQAHALKKADENNHQLVFARDYIYYNTDEKKEVKKMYSSCKSHEEYFKRVKKIGRVQPDYEIIQKDRFCRLFADIEWPLQWKTKAEVIDKFLSLLKNQIKKEWPDFDLLKFFPASTIKDSNCEEYYRKGLYFTDASSKPKNKGSLHFTHKFLYFTCVEKQKLFWKKIKVEFMKEEDWKYVDETTKTKKIKTPIDFSVYTKNRPMRLIGSGKMNEEGVAKRPLKPFIFGQKKIKPKITDFTATRNVTSTQDLKRAIKKEAILQPLPLTPRQRHWEKEYNIKVDLIITEIYSWRIRSPISSFGDC